jgi:hypothetical protein
MVASLLGVTAFVWMMHLPPQSIASDPWSWAAIAIGCVFYVWSFWVDFSWRYQIDVMFEEMKNRIVEDSDDSDPTAEKEAANV